MKKKTIAMIVFSHRRNRYISYLFIQVQLLRAFFKADRAIGAVVPYDRGVIHRSLGV